MNWRESMTHFLAPEVRPRLLGRPRAEAVETSRAGPERHAVALGLEKAKMKREIVRESMRWGSEFEPDIV